jgi:hypothetical protein
MRKYESPFLISNKLHTALTILSILVTVNALDLLFTYQREEPRHQLSLAIDCRQK